MSIFLIALVLLELINLWILFFCRISFYSIWYGFNALWHLWCWICEGGMLINTMLVKYIGLWNKHSGIWLMKNWGIFEQSLKPMVEWRMQFYKNCKTCIMFENQPMLGICKLLDWNSHLCTCIIKYCTWWHDCVNIARTIKLVNHLFKHFEYSLKNVWDLTCRKYGITFWL